MWGLLHDFRYSLRSLVKRPGFVLIATAALALGIGANTAIFSIVDAVLFRSLPYRNPARLVWATNLVPRQAQDLVFADEYAAWRTQNHVFESIAAYSQDSEYTLTGAGAPQRLRAVRATRSFLGVLGVEPKLGRNFLQEEDRPAGPKVVLLSNELWQSTFHSDPRIVGRVVSLDDTPYTIVGVLPADFEFLDNSPADMIVPLQLADTSIQISNGRVRVEIQPLNVVARLLPNATVDSAVADLSAIDKHVLNSLPGGLRMLAGGQAQVFNLRDHEIGDARPALLLLLCAVGFVLLIACANVANLELARSSEREKEMAIRRALGAYRGHLARLLFAESCTLALAGGLAGVAIAFGAVRLVRHFAPPGIPHLADARLDLRVLAFALVVSVLTGILFGLAPIVAAIGVSPSIALKEAEGHGSPGIRRAQRTLMVAEVALSFVLLVGGGLLTRSFVALASIQPGFDPNSVLTARVALPLDQYGLPAQQRAFFDALAERLQSIPGVVAAGATASLPLRGDAMISTVQIEGQPPTEINAANIPTTSLNVVTPGYFAALRIPLLEGRYLDDGDGPDASRVVVVNQAFVRRYFPHEDPVGKQFSAGLGPGGATPAPWTIVGVIGDTKQRSLTSDVMPEATVSAMQWPQFRMTLVLRASADPRKLASAVRHEVTNLDRNLPLYGVATMTKVLSEEFASQRFNAFALGGFAFLAALLAAVGIYGVMAYTVVQRTHEIGLRMALGAKPSEIMRIFLAQSLGLALFGMALGLAVSLALTRSIRGLLYGVMPSDPVTLIEVAAIVLVVSLLACWAPVRRATRVDPSIALRYE